MKKKRKKERIIKKKGKDKPEKKRTRKLKGHECLD